MYQRKLKFRKMYQTKLVHCCDVIPNLVVEIENFNFCLFVYLFVKISSEHLRKVEKIKPLGHSRAPKKMANFDHFPRPGEMDPYMRVSVYNDCICFCTGTSSFHSIRDSFGAFLCYCMFRMEGWQQLGAAILHFSFDFSQMMMRAVGWANNKSQPGLLDMLLCD